MIRPWSGRALAAASMGFLALAVAADAPLGDLWETTSQMSMPGMPSMPPQTAKLCTAKEWTQPPPPPQGQSCQQTDFRKTGNTVTWKIQCTGQMAMAGEGRIVFDTPTSYSGTIQFAVEGMAMTVRLTGKKTDQCDNPIN